MSAIKRGVQTLFLEINSYFNSPHTHVPPRIWLLFNNKLVSIATDKLVFMDDLAYGAKKRFSHSLRDFETSDITFHTTKHADALTSYSSLEDHAAQLSLCAVPETPLIVKVIAKSNVEEALVRFWKDLPEATLVADGEMVYLDLKDSYVLEHETLGRRFLVRSIYKELCEHFERDGLHKWVVAGTPGVGKTVFSTYYLWIAACENKTVVWEPSQSQEDVVSTYLMTSGSVERLAAGSPRVLNALSDPGTVYIVDGRVPILCKAWTLLVTSQQEHYKHLIKKAGTMPLYMAPWTYEELVNCKINLYGEAALPTKLMDQLYEWHGGVPRYVLELASSRFKALGDEDAVVDTLVEELTEAINKGRITDIVNAHAARTRDGEYSHRVLHICSHPSGNHYRFHVAWASRQVEAVVLDRITQEFTTDLKNFLRISKEYNTGNLRGLLFEPYAHSVLRAGGTFQVRRLFEGDPSSDQNIKVSFTAAKLKLFRVYEEVDTHIDVFWQPFSKNLSSIDLLRGPANFFQVTVAKRHPIKYSGLKIALNAMGQSASPLRLYFVVPPDLFWTYKSQPYHNAEGNLYQGPLGRVGDVEQWALITPEDPKVAIM
ncbi:hypothetical protein PSTG_00560 [Puccinia striiformis f. sp. tritici PST-78]|uniref:Crinkler (CRN) family protein n=1 Tax=Puccinia striiformis f. sp. tritici PST-78 TaxID=1165861 RepID=A0A0L0W459_9BASI|nr:hypothetical protein PSTG_00560 [Puccinia striiformis f. sp. tritici PST-78]